MKTHEQAILKCNKKAWQEIKNIKSAPNMMCVEQLISDALAKTFGVWNQGLMIIQMRKLGQMGEAESRVRLHRANWDRYMMYVRVHLIEMIPERLHSSIMYQRMVGYID